MDLHFHGISFGSVSERIYSIAGSAFKVARAKNGIGNSGFLAFVAKGEFPGLLSVT
jgi:hypothetical protein